MKTRIVSLSFLFIAMISFFGTRVAAEEKVSDEPKTEEAKKLNVKYSEVRAQVSPSLDLVLPSGNVTLSFTQPFNRLDLIFYLGYGIISSNINSELIFAYNIKRFRPYLKFFQSTDFENLVAPGISGSDIVLVPTDKYIERNRGFEVGIGYRLAPKLYLEPAFLLDDVFKGSLTEARVLEDGFDLVPKLSFIYDGVRALDPTNKLYFKGLNYRTVFKARFRDGFDTPVDMRNENQLLYHCNIRSSWFFILRGTLDYPIAIWEKKLAGYYELGGFDTIRGYENRSINAFSFNLFTVDTEHELFRDRELTLLKNRLRIHQFRLKLLIDSLLYQESIGLKSDLHYLASLGAGFSFVLSGQKNSHFKTELFIARGLQSGNKPILYFRTSLFNLEKSL